MIVILQAEKSFYIILSFKNSQQLQSMKSHKKYLNQISSIIKYQFTKLKIQ